MTACAVIQSWMGIPCLFAPNEWPKRRSDVTDMVKAFYDEHEPPFPNYADLDSPENDDLASPESFLAGDCAISWPTMLQFAEMRASLRPRLAQWAAISTGLNA